MSILGYCFRNPKAEIKGLVLNLPEGHDSFFPAGSAGKIAM
jgi:hypothetical protein